MRKNVLLGLLSFGFLFMACGEELDKTMLYGSWKADQFIRGDKAAEMNISNMGFTFNAENIYTYQSNLKYKEAGSYRLERSYLYSTDTLNNERVEKVVKITLLSPDSLHLSMNNGGITESIILHKLK